MHTCPECGSACYCHGDIEDHETDEDTYCEHHLDASCSHNDLDDEYDPSEDERLDDPRHGQAADINKVTR